MRPTGDAIRIETSSVASNSRQIRCRVRLTYWTARNDGLISVALSLVLSRDFRVLSPTNTSNSIAMSASVTPLMDYAMRMPPETPSPAAPSPVPVHGSALSPPCAAAEPPAQTEEAKQPPPFTGPTVCAALAQVVLTAEAGRRQSEQMTRAVAQAMQARNAHD